MGEEAERTDSASGVSGAVPYMGHSTFPTRRPRESATTKPVMRVRSGAKAMLIDTNVALF